MNKKNKANQTAQLSLLIATMVVIEVLSQIHLCRFCTSNQTNPNPYPSYYR